MSESDDRGLRPQTIMLTRNLQPPVIGNDYAPLIDTPDTWMQTSLTIMQQEELPVLLASSIRRNRQYGRVEREWVGSTHGEMAIPLNRSICSIVDVANLVDGLSMKVKTDPQASGYLHIGALRMKRSRQNESGEFGALVPRNKVTIEWDRSHLGPTSAQTRPNKQLSRIRAVIQPDGIIRGKRIEIDRWEDDPLPPYDPLSDANMFAGFDTSELRGNAPLGVDKNNVALSLEDHPDGTTFMQESSLFDEALEEMEGALIDNLTIDLSIQGNFTSNEFDLTDAEVGHYIYTEESIPMGDESVPVYIVINNFPPVKVALKTKFKFEGGATMAQAKRIFSSFVRHPEMINTKLDEYADMADGTILEFEDMPQISLETTLEFEIEAGAEFYGPGLTRYMRALIEKRIAQAYGYEALLEPTIKPNSGYTQLLAQASDGTTTYLNSPLSVQDNLPRNMRKGAGTLDPNHVPDRIWRQVDGD